MIKTIPCAIIGLGRIGSTLEDDALREKPATHAGAVRADSATTLAAGCDKDPEARVAFSQRWNIQKVYQDPRRMIRETRPGILHIATHEDSHLDFLDLAVKEEVPVVILEKPVSRSLPRARRLLNRLGPGRGRPTAVLVNHERRYSRDYLQVRKIIQEETYGPLLSMTGRLYMGMKRPVEGILLHDGTHLFDIVPFLTGKKLKNLRLSRRGPRPHTLYAQAQSGEVSVLCEIGNRRDHLVFEWELSFSRGRVQVGNGIYQEYESRESTYYEEMRSLYPVEKEPLGPTGYFAGMLKDAVRVYRDPKAVPVSSFADGVESLALVQKLRRRCRGA